MSQTNRREQVLANCKCLYGPDTDVFTLSYGHPGPTIYQAVAMKLDPFMATWTKLLHSKTEAKSRNEAMLSLLKETEAELTKLLSDNGFSVPVSGDGPQAMILHRRERSHSGASSSQRSDSSTFEFIPTPGSNSPGEAVVEETTQEEFKPAEPEVVCAYTGCKAPLPEPLAVKNPLCHDNAPSVTYEEHKVEKEPAPEPEPAPTTADWNWGSFSTAKSKKKSKKVVEDVPKADEPSNLDVQTDVAVEDFGGWRSTSKKGKKDKRKMRCGGGDIKVEEIPTPEPEPAVVIDDWASWGVAPIKKKNNGNRVVEESTQNPGAQSATSEPAENRSKTLCEPPTLVEIEPEPSNPEWDFWGASKKKKKSGNRVTFNEGPTVEVTSTIEAVPEEPADPRPNSTAPQEVVFDWRSWETPKKDKKEKSTFSFESTGEPPSVQDPLGSWGTSKKGNKKEPQAAFEDSIAGNALVPAPEPIPEDDDFGWDNFTSKKDKKKESKALLEGPAAEITPMPAPESNPEDDYFGWGNFTKKDKKKKSKIGWDEPAVEEPRAPSPEPETAVIENTQPLPDAEPEPPIEEFDWGFQKKKKKGKKGKVIAEEISCEETPVPVEEELVLEPEPIIIKDDFWATFATEKPKKNKLKLQESQPIDQPSTIEAPLETVVSQEAQDIRITVASLPERPSLRIQTLQPQPQVRQTVVLKIIHTSEAGCQTLQTMVNIPETTKAAVCDAVNSYLDLRSEVRHHASHRNLEIKFGAGKSGDIDLSSLENSRWPEYLEYLSQCTKFPELTIHAVDF